MTVSEPGYAELTAMARRGARFHAREQVFDSEYLKAGEFPERRIVHTSTGGLFFHRGRGLGKRDEQTHG